MSFTVDFSIHHSKIRDVTAIRDAIKSASAKHLEKDFNYRIIRRNIDARQKNVEYVLKAEIFEPGELIEKANVLDLFHELKATKEVYIIGAGPCGYFAALQLIRHGIKPILLERGKDVRDRRRDLKAIQQFGIVNEDSNYCFGEGGAGTYSDGKLYTRATKRGDINYVLQLLVAHGASEDILVDVHPHIGSNKLPDIISEIRKTIESRGGEVRFNSRLTDILIHENQVSGLKLGSDTIPCHQIILATGHSARDIYKILHEKNVFIEVKPFAVGFRIEHPQSLIDEIQYHCVTRPDTLPASSYNLACQVGDKGVFSFCMCPGGLIIPASTSPGEIVVNGMSLSRRDSPYANSGLVTSVDQKDFSTFSKHGPLQGMYFQENIERDFFKAGDGTQKAPAQRLQDFLTGRISQSLPDSSYIPGILNARVDQLFPKDIYQRLRTGLQQFGKKMPQYLSDEAVVVGSESRTSAPVRIPRDKETCMHPHIHGLYPGGEGAGYAGGILSAAMDGIRIADAIFRQFQVDKNQ
ncbi:MAG: FAD-dependent oxidoreductase [Saprospiraceae bacterium]|nr:FAD-dependent oxidoreductase [Candidatus Vicinibacter affinis]